MDKSWNEKLIKKHISKIKVIEKKFADIPAGSSMYISTPQEIKSEVDKINPGKTLSQKDLRVKLAKKHKTDYTCPVTTGIYLRIIAEASLEEYRNGKQVTQLTPFWRVIEKDSSLWKKLSFSKDEDKVFSIVA